jgi:hypothetical protein
VRAVHVAIQIAHALHAAHQAGVIHRNVRPKNVTLVRTAVDDAFVKLTGFGKAPKKKSDRYVPPEGNSKKVSGVHTDVFGVGACLDKMLGPSTRREPALARIVARATATDPKDRYPTAGALEAALRAWSNGDVQRTRDPAWYALGALLVIGVGMIVFNDHSAHSRPMTAPLVAEAHAATAPSPAPVQKAAAARNDTTEEGDRFEIGPPPLDSISGPAAAPPPPEAAAAAAAANAGANAARASAKGAAAYVAPSGTFYVDEPLRYVSASEGEAWRVSTTKKVAQCIEAHGTGDCALNSMQLSCTFDRYGLMHCARVTGWDKAGQTCTAPHALEDCVGRAASGMFAKPKFDRPDVQLAEMKYWIRRAR